MNGNASFAGEDVPFADGNAAFVDWDVPFTDGNAAARTFGRAHRRRPYGFVWVDCAWVIDVVWADYVWMVDFVWADCAWVVGGVWWITRGWLSSFLHYSARMPLRILFFYAFYFCSVYFFNG